MSNLTPHFNRQLAGLRGIAVSIVVLLHVNFPGFKGGYLGVDLFFVLSGYFITGTLLRARQTGRPFLAEFYWHRFLRLFPALALVCIAVAAVSLGDENRVRDMVAGLTHVSNWTRALDARLPLYLAHTWSLAVEEQFYVLWPPVFVALLYVIKQQRSAAWIALCLAAFVMAWRTYATTRGYTTDRMYNGFDFRADGLLLGCALALATFGDASATTRLAAWSRIMVLPALAVLLTLFARFNAMDRANFAYGYTAASISLVIIVAYFALPVQRPAFVNRWLGDGFMVWLGEISYGIYLWHFPIALYLYNQDIGWWSIPIAVGSTLVLASLSYRFVERPARALRAWAPRKAARAGGAALAYSLLAFAAGIWFFFEGNIRSLAQPGLTVQILAYGPRTIQPGVPFSRQVDGSSAVWITTDESVSTATRVRIGDLVLSTSVGNKIVTALVPSGFHPASGTIDLWLIDTQQRPISNRVTITVATAE